MEWNIALTAGLILAAGTLGGALARAVRLPPLTGYLAAGVLFGRQGFDVLSHTQMEVLAGPVDDFTMALVLFLLGGQFHGEVLKQRPARLFSASILEAVFTILVVTLATWIGLGEFFPALLLGILAVAVAPATTLLVLEEYDARGPLTSRLMLFTSFSNFLTVLLFEAALLFLAALRTGSVPEGSVLAIIWDLAGSLLFGLVAGHALILLQSRIGRGHFALPLLTVIFLTIGLSRLTGVPSMLTFLIAGAVVANRSHYFEPIAASIDVFARPAYVVFFVLGGWHLDFSLFPAVGLTAGLYVGARTLGKVLGTHLGLRTLGLLSHPPLQAGPGLLCQAGAAIALAGLLAPLDPELSARLLNII
ncbi:MAG: cation:proton antiporter, partial [Planctomycetota bacterium]